jgi:hypothetical protein
MNDFNMEEDNEYDNDDEDDEWPEINDTQENEYMECSSE